MLVLVPSDLSVRSSSTILKHDEVHHAPIYVSTGVYCCLHGLSHQRL